MLNISVLFVSSTCFLTESGKLILGTICWQEFIQWSLALIRKFFNLPNPLCLDCPFCFFSMFFEFNPTWPSKADSNSPSFLFLPPRLIFPTCKCCLPFLYFHPLFTFTLYLCNCLLEISDCCLFLSLSLQSKMNNRK